MQARRLIPEDYELLCEWWAAWRWTPPTIEMLPSGGTSGIMIFDDNGTPMCAGFLYTTNSKMAWIEFIISNPNVRNKELRKTALSSLIHALTYAAKSLGYSYCYTLAVNQSLINRYIDCGYRQTGTNYTELIKKI